MKFGWSTVALVCLGGFVGGWFARGFITPPPPTAAEQVITQNIPTAESVSPAKGSGSHQTFTVTVSAPREYATIWTVSLLINKEVEASHSCYPKYDVSTGDAGLIDDSGVSLLGARAQSGTKLENSQCVVDSAGITVHGEGKKVSISIPITFKPSFAGAKSMWVAAMNVAGKSSELEKHGAWTVAGF